MSVYKHPSKSGCQMIKISHGRKGRAEYISFAGSREEALMYERELRGLADRSDPGFSDMLPDFKIGYKNRVRENTYKSLEYSLARLQPFFEGFKLRHITSTLVEQYKAQRLADGVKKRTINIELSALSAYITWINDTLGAGYPLPKRFGKRETAPDMPQVLTIREITAILSQLDGDMWLVVALMGLCGMRRNEVLTLTADQVDPAGQTIRVAGKGGHWRMIPVVIPLVMDRLKERKENNPAGPLFVSPKTGKARVDIRKSLRRAATKAGVSKHITPHLFRHSFATALINDGTDIRIIQELLGHSELSTTQTYTQVAATSKRSAVEKLVANVATTLDEQS